ncbi:hypothetical protein PoB_003842700 [Plakobranchus ocellatus]|uniref:Uncharacterized protein n=1 Tax=Plakobranchus ocellatus TaxID=259542 RepID=A0AAV4AXX9_9GAST|nr:hypothetical protein PoB_003842700 [Plakobranchus ocellatus]
MGARRAWNERETCEKTMIAAEGMLLFHVKKGRGKEEDNGRKDGDFHLECWTAALWRNELGVASPLPFHTFKSDLPPRAAFLPCPPPL